jgi:hypothetical protein
MDVRFRTSWSHRGALTANVALSWKRRTRSSMATLSRCATGRLPRPWRTSLGAERPTGVPSAPFDHFSCSGVTIRQHLTDILDEDEFWTELLGVTTDRLFTCYIHGVKSNDGNSKSLVNGESFSDQSVAVI